MSRRTNIFISYSHKDEKWLDRLKTHLISHVDQDLIDLWDDSRIEYGQKWRDEIDKALDAAIIAIVLVSADFLASSFINKVELPRLLDKKKGIPIVPILVKPCSLRGTQLNQFQMIEDNIAMIDMSEGQREDVWKQTTVTVMNAVLRSKARFHIVPSNARVHSLRDRGIQQSEAPEKLPYQCDRRPQLRWLNDAFQVHIRKRPSRPFLCLVHGHERECHDAFSEQILSSLPNLLKIDRSATKIRHVKLTWASSNETQLDVLNQLFCEELAFSFFKDRKRPIEEVRQAFINNQPVFVQTNLYAEKWQPYYPALIKAWFNFWDTFPAMIPGIQAFVFMHIQFNTFQLLKRLKINNFVKDIDFGQYQMFCGTVLPQLRAVKRSEVEEWLRQDLQHMFTEGLLSTCHIEELMKEIRALYRRWRLRSMRSSMPMDSLATELKTILTNCIANPTN